VSGHSYAVVVDALHQELVQRLSHVELPIRSFQRIGLEAHVLDAPVRVMVDVEARVRHGRTTLVHVFERAVLAELGAWPRITVRDSVAGAAYHLLPARAIGPLEGLIDRDDPEVLVDDEEGILLGVCQRLKLYRCHANASREGPCRYRASTLKACDYNAITSGHLSY